MIVATAGHVDHGKTSLIRALTGVDTDRLAEEKRRGMSIELGFAYADFGLDSLIGFVDVPGHERFVRNMLAGVAAIDCALLVVAANDGPMPQTLEHLAILELLGVSEAVVAITKIDRVEPARVQQVQEQIQALLEKSPMRGAPMVPVVATNGVGMQPLRAELIAVAHRNALRPRSLAGNFRLAVDRVFSLTGAGLIVSGAVYAGRAQIGDRLIISPSGMEVRIRGIHANNVASNEARCGARCALNLSGPGLEKELIHRGDWIVAPCLHAPTQRLDVDLRILPTESRALIDGATVQLHLAAASVSARAATLGAKNVMPGAIGLAQLVLDEPIAALYGDRFVLRDQSGLRTIGGGSVIDPFAPARGRSKPSRLRELEALRSPSARDALRQILANGKKGTAGTTGTTGVDWTAFLLSRNLSASDSDLLEQDCDVQLLNGTSGPIALDKAHWNAMRAFVVSVLKERHQQHPDSQGLSHAELLAIMCLEFSALPLPIFRAMVESQVQAKGIERHGLSVCLPGWVPRLNAQDQALMDALRIELSQAGLRPPIVGELSKTLNRALPDLMADLRRLSSGGHLVAVANNRYFLPETVLELVWVALKLDHDASGQGFDAAAYRDASGIGRNLTIQVLEFLDRQGFTRFARNRRWIVAAALPAALKIRLQDINRKEGEKP